MIKLNSLIKAVIFEWQKLCGKNYAAKKKKKKKVFNIKTFNTEI